MIKIHQIFHNRFDPVPTIINESYATESKITEIMNETYREKNTHDPGCDRVEQVILAHCISS